jgi:hypothetical protein
VTTTVRDKQASLEATAPRDWFIAAIESDGTVASCLSAVLSELDARSHFVRVLRDSLDAHDPRGVDAVSDVGQRVRLLDRSLGFRLPMLSEEREGAWFRVAAMTSVGPFAGTLDTDPVLAPYDVAAVETVRRELVRAFEGRSAKLLPFARGTPCLWRTLVELAERLERIVALPAPFAHLRLDRLPDGLPESLDSRALRAFLLNVRSEILATRELLDGCYRELLATSERLFARQRDSVRERAREARSSEAHARANRAAGDLREEMRRRREGAVAPGGLLLGPDDLAALRFMGFRQMPSSADLRKRYLTMAKDLHPDRSSGSDTSFKLLVTAYNRLTERLA